MCACVCVCREREGGGRAPKNHCQRGARRRGGGGRRGQRRACECDTSRGKGHGARIMGDCVQTCRCRDSQAQLRRHSHVFPSTATCAAPHAQRSYHGARRTLGASTADTRATCPDVSARIILDAIASMRRFQQQQVPRHEPSNDGMFQKINILSQKRDQSEVHAHNQPRTWEELCERAECAIASGRWMASMCRLCPVSDSDLTAPPHELI